MDSRHILSASGDQKKGGDVIEVNEGTYVLKNRWTGPEDKQADYEENSGGSAKCRNNEEDLKMKEVDFKPFDVPRENLDTRLRKLMSGDPESIPVFMWEYRADWIDSERKKRHQKKTNHQKGTTEKRSGDKSSDQKIKLESINTQVAHVEQLFKNVKMSPDKQNETRKGYEMNNVKKIYQDLSDKQNETRKGNEIKNYPLEEQLRCDFGLISNIEDLNESFTNTFSDSPIRVDINEEIEHRPTIDDVDVDYIVRQFPLEKVSRSSIKPSGLGSKLTRISLKDSKPVSAAIHNALKEIDSKANVEKNFDQIKEPEVKDLKIDVEGEVDESHCSTKMENYNEEKVNVTPNELIKAEPTHNIKRVPSRKRKFIEVLGSIEDRFTKEAKLDIKTRLEEQIINAAMEKFDKWWEEQELEHEKKGQGLKTEDDQREIF